MMQASKPTNAGIITDETGTRQIPASTRADGSTRRAIKIRPGYQPPEDVALYKNRTAENFRNRNKGIVPGAEVVKPETAAPAATATTRAVPGAAATGGNDSHASTTANKNAKRREARKKAAAASAGTTDDRKPDATAKPASAPAAKPAEPAVDPQAEREKKARGLRKKLKQARELQTKKDGGATLLPEQIAKVIRINELIRELEALGLDANETETAGETGGGGNTTT